MSSIERSLPASHATAAYGKSVPALTREVRVRLTLQVMVCAERNQHLTSTISFTLLSKLVGVN